MTIKPASVFCDGCGKLECTEEHIFFLAHFVVSIIMDAVHCIKRQHFVNDIALKSSFFFQGLTIHVS